MDTTLYFSDEYNLRSDRGMVVVWNRRLTTVSGLPDISFVLHPVVGYCLSLFKGGRSPRSSVSVLVETLDISEKAARKIVALALRSSNTENAVLLTPTSQSKSVSNVAYGLDEFLADLQHVMSRQNEVGM